MGSEKRRGVKTSMTSLSYKIDYKLRHFVFIVSDNDVIR